MTLKTKSIKFNKTSIVFAQLVSGKWVVPAKLLGQALGYSKEGGKFVDALVGWGLKLNDDVVIMEGVELAELKQVAPELGVSLNAPSVTFLSIYGVTRALLRSRSAMAEEFRTFLIKNADDILSDDARNKLPVRAKKAKKEIEAVKSENVSDELQKPLTVLREMAKTGFFSKEDLAGYYKRVFDSTLPVTQALPALPATAPAVTKKDATQLVPVSNIQASSLTPNFASVRSFFLTGHQKHPDFLTWISAEEIGEKCGKTADQVKTFSSNYARTLGRDLANNQAKAAILQGGGYFDGVSTLVDKYRLPTLVDREIGCMTTWYLTEDGMLLWRNYWSPEAVEAIMKLIAASPTVRAPKLPAPALPLPEGKVHQFEGAVQAPAPANGSETKAWEGASTVAHPEQHTRR